MAAPRPAIGSRRTGRYDRRYRRCHIYKHSASGGRVSYCPMTEITEETFEETLRTFVRSEQIDLSDVAFIDPYGMLGLLEIGELCMLEDIRKAVVLPRSEDVCAYLERMDFFTHARRYFSLDQPYNPPPPPKNRTRESDVLLEITPVERSNDIHIIVGTVRQRAQTILAKHLHY